MPGAILGDVAFSVAVVVADAAQMAKQLARGDGPFFLRKRGAVFLDGRVEVQFAVLPELQKGGGGDGFGKRSKPEERR